MAMFASEESIVLLHHVVMVHTRSKQHLEVKVDDSGGNATDAIVCSVLLSASMILIKTAGRIELSSGAVLLR